MKLSLIRERKRCGQHDRYSINEYNRVYISKITSIFFYFFFATFISQIVSNNAYKPDSEITNVLILEPVVSPTGQGFEETQRRLSQKEDSVPSISEHISRY